MARMTPASALGFLAFAVAIAGGVYWGLVRAEPRPPRAQAGALMLRAPAGEAAEHHRHAFTLGRPSHVRVEIDNPDRAVGSLQVGPPNPTDQSRFDPDPKHTRTLVIPAQAHVVFEWIDLAVGTRIVDVRFKRPARVGMDIATRPDQ